MCMMCPRRSHFACCIMDILQCIAQMEKCEEERWAREEADANTQQALLQLLAKVCIACACVCMCVYVRACNCFYWIKFNN